MILLCYFVFENRSDVYFKNRKSDGLKYRTIGFFIVFPDVTILGAYL